MTMKDVADREVEKARAAAAAVAKLEAAASLKRNPAEQAPVKAGANWRKTFTHEEAAKVALRRARIARDDVKRVVTGHPSCQKHYAAAKAHWDAARKAAKAASDHRVNAKKAHNACKRAGGVVERGIDQLVTLLKGTNANVVIAEDQAIEVGRHQVPRPAQARIHLRQCRNASARAITKSRQAAKVSKVLNDGSAALKKASSASDTALADAASAARRAKGAAAKAGDALKAARACVKGA